MVARAPLLFSIRLWASVCLALFVAFWLELDNPFWAGTSAAIVCYPQLGASLRKGWFRMIGTVIGATMIVVLTAWFPQDRIAFLVLLAVWGGICAFVGSLLRNFASYSAALAGYTAISSPPTTSVQPAGRMQTFSCWRSGEPARSASELRAPVSCWPGLILAVAADG
ncbi:MAG TPA: FUSC family protein [Stellaceae bacterium]|nr:FUSC family protein [Stellaceae bacterium]